MSNAPESARKRINFALDDDPAELSVWPKQQPQRQDSLDNQLTDLHRIAARLGMYDAADWLWKRIREREADR